MRLRTEVMCRYLTLIVYATKKQKNVSLRGGRFLPDKATPSRARRLLRRKHALSEAEGNIASQRHDKICFLSIEQRRFPLWKHS